MSLASRPTGILLGILFLVGVWFIPKFIVAVVRGTLISNGVPVSELGSFLFDLAGYGFYFLFPWLWLKFKEKRPFRSIGFWKTSQTGNQILVGALAGLAAALSVVGTAAALGIVTVRVTPEGISAGVLAVAALLLLGFVVQGTAEEVLYRGYALQLFRKPLGLIGAIVAQGVLFSLSHGQINSLAAVNLVLVSVFLTFWAIAENGLWGVSAFHVLWNWMLGTVFGGVNSGNAFPGTVLLTEGVTTNTLLSGGKFGLEGSLITTLLFAFLCFVLYPAFRRNKRSRLDVALAQE